MTTGHATTESHTLAELARLRQRIACVLATADEEASRALALPPLSRAVALGMAVVKLAADLRAALRE